MIFSGHSLLLHTRSELRSLSLFLLPFYDSLLLVSRSEEGVGVRAGQGREKEGDEGDQTDQI